MSTVVLIDPDVLAPFLEQSIAEYRLGLESAGEHFPRAWALLVGSELGGALRVQRLEFGDNARARDRRAREEFTEVIAPRFGAVYASDTRGFWCDSRTLLHAHREAEADGLDILGSVHLHPDWHRIGLAHERWLRLSERPTPMDEYLFASTGWPLHLICYFESRGEEIVHTVAAWSADSQELPLRFTLAPREALRPLEPA